GDRSRRARPFRRGSPARRAQGRAAQFHAAAGHPPGRDDATQSQRQGRPRSVAPRVCRMKPLGPIPAGYEAIDGELAIDGRAASELVERAGGTPLFVYSAELIRRRVAELRAAMPERLRLHYAVKANPYAPLLELMTGLVDGFDIASQGEFRMALEAGQEPARISFAGPGKRDEEIRAAIAAGVTLNLESAGEARRALAIGD